MRECSCLLFVCNAGLILSGRRMVEDERALMELRLVGLEEGCNDGIKEERCGESRDRAK